MRSSIEDQFRGMVQDETGQWISREELRAAFATDLRSTDTPDALRSLVVQWRKDADYHEANPLNGRVTIESAKAILIKRIRKNANELEAALPAVSRVPDLMCARCGYVESRHWRGRCPVYGEQLGIFESSGDVFADLAVSRVQTPEPQKTRNDGIDSSCGEEG